MIKVFDVVYIMNRKALKEAGLNVGEVALVASLKPLPAKASDPYLQRIYAVIVKVTEDGVELPAEDNDYKSYLVDPRYLEVVEEDTREKYIAAINKQYGEDTSGS